jgi:diguanylate cyclase (GGDEF)-like protein/PAS domain S-box-containing protein
MPVTAGDGVDPLLRLLDALPDAVIVTDALPPQRILWAGGAFTEITGEQPEQMPGRTLGELCSTTSSIALERLSGAIARDEAADGRIRFLGADGVLTAVFVRVVPLPRHDGSARAAWLARPDSGRLLACIDEAVYSCVLTGDGRNEVVYASPRFEALVGAAPAHMTLFAAWRARIHPDDRARVRESFDTLASGHPVEREYRLRCADGSERVVLDRANPHPPEDGTVTVDGILIDVTERRQTALAFAETSSQLAHVIESIDEYLYTDAAGVGGHLGRAVYASPGIFRVLGRAVPLDLLNEAWEAAVHPDDAETFRSSHVRMAAGEPFEVEYRVVRPNGEARWVLDRARPRRTPDGQILIDGLIADVTERHRVADELAAARDEADRRSRIDALTGIFNRGHFTEALTAELDRAARANARVGLLIADIDHFKRVNDTHGHLAGDRVLAEIAERLATAVRRYDTLARFGGEEFVVLVPDVQDMQSLVATGEQLREAVRALPFRVDRHELAITVSIGVALTHPGATPDSLIGAADVALYAAKDAGRDCVRAAPDGASTRSRRG